jgi:hypothetical protein
MPQQSGFVFVRNNPQYHNLTGEGGDGQDEDAQDENDGRDEDAQDANDTSTTNDDNPINNASHANNTTNDDDDELLEPANKLPAFETDFWKIVDARNLFALGSSSSVKEILQERLKILDNVSNEVEGWQNIIYSSDTGNHCSKYDKFVLRSKGPFLRLAYVLALQYRGSVEENKTWARYCDDAASMLNSLGFTYSAFSQHAYSTFEWVSDDG